MDHNINNFETSQVKTVCNYDCGYIKQMKQQKSL